MKLMKEQHPLYKVPTRKTIKDQMEKIYEEEMKNFRRMVCQVSNICLTTDIWTDINMNSMLGITLHGLFENKQINATIGVFKLTQAHTADHIAKVLMDSLAQFSLTNDQVMAVVTDNGANMVKAVHQSVGKSHHIPCFAHTLNLVCMSSLNIPEASDLIAKCRNIVVWMKRHVKANDHLQQLQSSAGVPEGKMLKVILDVKTRWNSTFYMLERFIKLISYIGQVLLNFSDAPQMISTKDKDDMVEIIALLKPLEAMTTQISGEKYATLSLIIPIAHCGRQQILKVVCKSPMATKLKATILTQFDRRFGAMEHSYFFAASTLLDPRFKKIHFQDPMALATVMRHIRSEMVQLSQRDDESLGSMSDGSSTGDVEFDLWAHHKSLAHKRRKKDNDGIQIQDELSFFLNTPVLELKRDVINAWEEMRTVYPKLYIISRRYCYLLGTSVPAERLFSKAGATATEKRNRLTTSRLSKLLFLNSVMNK